MNVDLPTDIDAEVCRYVEEDELTSWTVMIHDALHIYRGQFWSKEQLNAELQEAIEESLRSVEEEGTIEVTPQFWRDMKKRCRKNMRRIKELQAKGKPRQFAAAQRALYIRAGADRLRRVPNAHGCRVRGDAVSAQGTKEGKAQTTQGYWGRVKATRREHPQF